MTWLTRSARAAAVLALAVSLLGATGQVTGASTGSSYSVSVAPRTAVPGHLMVVTLTLPARTAAAGGRVLFDADAAEFVGVAPLGGGTALYPEPVPGGVAFGAYGLHAQGGGTVLRFILDPQVAGPITVRVVVDATANAAGQPLGVSRVTGSGGHAASHVAAGLATHQDLGVLRADWDAAALRGGACGHTPAGVRARAGGCADVAALQATYAALGSDASATGVLTRAGSVAAATKPHGTVAYAHTWTVNSTADTPDHQINDICADAGGACTLRAAIAEANAQPGNDLIAFDIPGPPPQTIQLTPNMPLPSITSLNGTLTIDGYTQPGSAVNTATVGSNAIPGVELRGNGYVPHQTTDNENTLYITSPGNTLRGLLIDNSFRGIMVDGTDAHDNVIVGNWIGYTPAGGAPATTGEHGILLNTGANHNFVGTPALADRNLIGNLTKGIDSYGPGTDDNTIQNNVFCMGPTGFTLATCATGVDHDFGPKNELLGGTDANTRNVIGPTTLQGIEYSHGWNPNDSSDTSTTWQILGNQAIGNWVGFQGDGSYRPNFRSGQLFGKTDNGQGINVYDGASQNVIQGNVIASVYDGIQVMAPRAKSNIIQGNLIGVSPLGEAAPLTGWGIKVRWATTLDVIDSNTIRNAAKGGIGLVNTDNVGNAQAVAANIRISRNIVTDTNGPAIYLAPSQLHPSTGANILLKAPVITSATRTLVRGKGIPGARVEVYRATRGAGKNGLPDRYLGHATVASNGTWSLTLTVGGSLHRVTALQIAADQNTSALSKNLQVTQ